MMSIKIRAVPKGWAMLAEIWVEPDGLPREWHPVAPISFANGEQMLGVRVFKPVGGRQRKAGLFRLYRSKLGHPKFRVSPLVQYAVTWAPRPYANNQPERGGYTNVK